VAQGVFIALAKGAAQLAERPVLSGWLHRTAQNIAAQTVRTEVRRRVREQEAVTMNELLAAEPDAVWAQIAPQLDGALGELSEPDRDALLLRYFERKSAREMAQTLGISDEAAQKRVNRAVERLREFLAKRGVAASAGGLVAVISANAVQAAPVGLAATISTAVAAAAVGLSASAGAGATGGWLGTLAQVSRIKLVGGLAGAALVGVTAFLLLHTPPRPSPVAGADSTAATAAAVKNFERVITEFGQVRQRGYRLADLATPELSELRRPIIGKPAPEIDGADLDGQPMKLSDYRGKVVVLVFWWPGYSEALEHRKLVERLAGKPFALLGVYGDDDLARAQADVEKYGITWPSFRDRRDGPISTEWNVRSWPNLWVLDRRGTIRYRDVRWQALTDAVDKLLGE
jgi:RNA polymerase sigma factor (sigma-70 family)